MSGRVLLIDAIATNRMVLRVKLETASYQVTTCAGLKDALAVARESIPDLVVASDNLSGTDVATLCASLRECVAPRLLPIIVVTGSQSLSKRLDTLAAGADEVFERPVDHTLMLARIRGLMRDRGVIEDYQLREDVCGALGFEDAPCQFEGCARVLLVGRNPAVTARLTRQLQRRLGVRIDASTPANSLAGSSVPLAPDVIVLLANHDDALIDLRLLTEWRSRSQTRSARLIVVTPHDRPDIAAAAMDYGANELLLHGACALELLVRLRRQIDCKQQLDRSRRHLHQGVEAAMIDPLTGAHNRRFALMQLQRMIAGVGKGGARFAVLIADIDHFKRVNDRFGHGVGDKVLCQAANRLRSALSPMDQFARIGGEEFIILRPNAGRAEAVALARQLCTRMHSSPVTVTTGDFENQIDLSISVGATVCDGPVHDKAPDLLSTLLAAADTALYAAKNDGRNQALFSTCAA